MNRIIRFFPVRSLQKSLAEFRIFQRTRTIRYFPGSDYPTHRIIRLFQNRIIRENPVRFLSWSLADFRNFAGIGLSEFSRIGLSELFQYQKLKFLSRFSSGPQGSDYPIPSQIGLSDSWECFRIPAFLESPFEF